MNYEVDVLVNGKPVRKIAHNNKVFVEGRFGQEYEVRIKNNTWSRILAVISVDGTNIVDGEIAGKPVGYVINGYSSFHGKGFRVSNEVIHPFKFSSKDKSYAAKSNEGDTSNVGAIGVQIFQERIKANTSQWYYNYKTNYPPMQEPPYNPVPIWYYPRWVPYETMQTTNGSVSNSLGAIGNVGNQGDCAVQYSSAGDGGYLPDFAGTYRISPDSAGSLIHETTRGFDMGTEFSRKEVQDKVVDVEFEIGSLAEEFTIYYASSLGLKSMGVPVERPTQAVYPNPFPNKFCKPPKW